MTTVIEFPHRESFSTKNPKLQLAFDSVSLGAAKKCARFYQLSVVEGWQGRTQSIHLKYGILYHRAMEVFEHHRAQPDYEYEAALLATLEDLAEHCVEADGSWWNVNEGLSEKQAAENTKTLPNLFRSVVWYLDQLGKDDPCKTLVLANGKPAVELSFRYAPGLTTDDGEEVFLCGHLDRVVEYNGDHYFMDWKTSKNTINQSSAKQYFSQFSPNNQMSGYSLAGRLAFGVHVKGGIINATQIAKGFSRFERAFVPRTDGQLQEWLNDAAYWIKQVEGWAKSNYWPMNDTSCSHYGGCTFQGICSKDPEVREIFLKSDFIRQPWDPFQVRGDI